MPPRDGVMGLFPELSGAGGVQRGGRHIAAIVACRAAEKGGPYRFFSLNDAKSIHHEEIGSKAFAYRGFRRSKAAFVRASLQAALERPRLVIAAHPYLAPVARLVQAAGKSRVIVFAHGIEVARRLSNVRRWSLAAASLVVAPSRDTQSLLVNVQGIPPEKTRILPWGLDPQFLQVPPAGGALLRVPFPAGPVILSVARLDASERYKGVDTLIDALPAARAAAPEVSLVVVGDGNDRPRLEALARDAGVAGNVHFLGRLEGNQLRACYEQSAVFAMPSRGEGFGLVFLEAMACGRPVVGGAHGGTPDIIEDGVTGFLVPHGDRDRLAEALIRLLTHEDLRAEMGARARQRVMEKYRFEDFEARLVQLLEDECGF